jgi:ATP dependent DNA ligase domain
MARFLRVIARLLQAFRRSSYAGTIHSFLASSRIPLVPLLTTGRSSGSLGKSVLLDGEGIVYDQNCMPSFDLIHSKQYDREVSLVAFDVVELDGDDVRRRPLLDRKARLAKLVAMVRTASNTAMSLSANSARAVEAVMHRRALCLCG